MKAAPIPPLTIPRNTNQGNWVRLVNSNGGTVYQGRIPKKLRDTIVATTDAKTSGANRFIEKLPSTISAANTAPEMGALYAAISGAVFAALIVLGWSGLYAGCDSRSQRGLRSVRMFSGVGGMVRPELRRRPAVRRSACPRAACCSEHHAGV